MCVFFETLQLASLGPKCALSHTTRGHNSCRASAWIWVYTLTPASDLKGRPPGYSAYKYFARGRAPLGMNRERWFGTAATPGPRQCKRGVWTSLDFAVTQWRQIFDPLCQPLIRKQLSLSDTTGLTISARNRLLGLILRYAHAQHYCSNRHTVGPWTYIMGPWLDWSMRLRVPSECLLHVHVAPHHVQTYWNYSHSV